MEIEFDDLLNTLFDTQPREINSIPVRFDTLDIKKLFESLLTIFTMGLKKKYGNDNGNVDLSTIGEEKINQFKKYFYSIGFSFNFNILNDTNENRNYSQRVKYSNINITNKTVLSDLFLPILSNNRIYLINFNYI